MARAPGPLVTPSSVSVFATSPGAVGSPRRFVQRVTLVLRGIATHRIATCPRSGEVSLH